MTIKYSIQNLLNEAMIDLKTGKVTRLWYRFILDLFRNVGSGQSILTLVDIEKEIAATPRPVNAGPLERSVQDVRAEHELTRVPDTSRLELALKALESQESQRRSYEGQIDKLERRLKALESAFFATRVGSSSGSALAGTITTSFTAGSVLFVGPSGVLSQDNANFFWNDANNWLGIGHAPASILDILQTQNAESLLQLTNGSAGAAAQATIRASNGTSVGQLVQFGTGFTTAGIFRQNGSMVYATGAGGLTFATGANQPVYFAVNNTQVGQFDANRFTLSKPLKPPSYAVAGLPAATAGDVAFVTDSTLGIAAGLGLAPVGGGTNGVTVFCDNTPAWKIG